MADTQHGAQSASGTIDFTMMYVTHDAFRRDLDRLVAAAAAGRATGSGVRAGWDNFKRQLHLHHSVEDSDLWPRVQVKAAGSPLALDLLADMEAEHAQIDPLLAAVDQALADGGRGLADRAEEARSVLVHHLEHEEQDALPLIQHLLAPADWKAFAGKMRVEQGLKGAAVYVPWIVDGVPAEGRQRFFGAMAPPVRVLNRLLWEPRYRKQELWSA
ncbi:hemerythrin domain-containing protein [Streptomyces beijiangensis]|uniref:Hemerythrin domain-containing protein n=1 Tax=Streptomyces beijiangensis TaxID=163361 RepID=A0A939JHJ1_9ACTN|nr:hemerythrin domain-containing protein [Streptomyces beijiangensis]MBO0512672.1 hemerythrin domain-containing protein [Streptomyces beijiangensis]